MNTTTRAFASIPLVGMAVFVASAALAQNYPNRPVRIITSAAGSSLDIAARLIAQGISPPLQQSLIVDNRTDTIAGKVAAEAAPDGYTLLLAGGTFLIGPLLQKVDYDPVRDFAPITLLATTPSVLVVVPSLPVKSVQDLIALVKAKPGTLNYATTGVGSSGHLAVELLGSMAGGLNMVRVDYKATSGILTDLIADRVQLLISSVGNLMPLVKTGKLKALAVTSAEPSELAPGLPTIAASLPGYHAELQFGLYAPANTPGAVINRLNAETVRFVKIAEAKEKFLSAGLEVVGSSPEEFADNNKSQFAEWSKVIKEAGIKVQ